MTAIAKLVKTHPAATKCCGWEVRLGKLVLVSQVMLVGYVSWVRLVGLGQASYVWLVRVGQLGQVSLVRLVRLGQLGYVDQLRLDRKGYLGQ